mgnify:CR=1 FL=1
MGYLNSDTITVDAILTKHGRYQLSLGGGLDIWYYALSDDGVDYSLWNTSHPSGSDSYGEAISNLPQIEAVPDDYALMKYKLMTIDRNIQYWPVITDVKDYTFKNTVRKLDIIPQTDNFEEESYTFTFSNANIINFQSPVEDAGIPLGHTDYKYPVRADQPRILQFRGYRSMTVSAKSLDVLRSTNVQIVGEQTGTVTNINLTVEPTRD